MFNWKYLAILFVALNLILLYKIHDLQSRLDQNLVKSDAVLAVDEIAASNEYEFPSHLESELITPSKQGLKAVFFFNDRGCESCIQYEVNKLNQLYDLFEDQIEVFTISKDSTYLERVYDANFSYERIDNIDFQNVKVSSLEPFVLIIDKNRLVQQYYFAARNGYDEADKFYTKLTSLLESI